MYNAAPLLTLPRRLSFAGVPRHQGRVIKLQYCGEGPIQRTLMLVGKVRGVLLIDSVATADCANDFFFL